MGECASLIKIMGGGDPLKVFENLELVIKNEYDIITVPAWPERWIAFMGYYYPNLQYTMMLIIFGEKNTIKQEFHIGKDGIKVTSHAEISDMTISAYITHWPGRYTCVYEIKG